MAAVASPVRADDVASLYRSRTVPAIPEKLPDTFGVMPFENRSGVTGLDWMSAGVPFVVGEKVEHHPELRPVYGPYVVPRGTRPVKTTAAAVAAFGNKHNADWVWTGHFERPDWELRLSISLWRVSGRSANRIGTVVRRGDFKNVHRFIAESVDQLLDEAKLPLGSHAQREVRRPPTHDFYAFTLFGRGLAARVGTLGGEDADKASKTLERAVFIDPKLAEGWRVLGQHRLELGKPGLARSAISRALGERERYYPAMVARADMFQQEKKMALAAELYEKALVMRPWHLEPRYQLGKVYWELTKIDEAFRELSRVVKADPGDIRARRLLVMIHAAKGRKRDLVRELEQVARLDPKDVGTKMDLAAAYMSVGRAEDAATTYEQVLSDDPKHVQALKFLADIRKDSGDAAGAVRLYDKVIQIKPSDPRPYFLLGALFVESGNDAAARKIYLKAKRFRSYQPEVFNNLGAIAYRQGQLEASLWYLERAVGRKPNRARYRYNYALSLSASGQTVDALTNIEAGLKLDPDDPEMRYLRGVVLLRLGRAGEAEKEFRAVLAAVPDHQNARHNLEMLEQLSRRAREGEVVIEGR